MPKRFNKTEKIYKIYLIHNNSLRWIHYLNNYHPVLLYRWQSFLSNKKFTQFVREPGSWTRPDPKYSVCSKYNVYHL